MGGRDPLGCQDGSNVLAVCSAGFHPLPTERSLSARRTCLLTAVLMGIASEGPGRAEVRSQLDESRKRSRENEVGVRRAVRVEDDSCSRYRAQLSDQAGWRFKRCRVHAPAHPGELRRDGRVLGRRDLQVDTTVRLK